MQELLRYKTAQQAVAGGHKVDYVATIEEFPLRTSSGEIEATMVTYSYIRQPEESDRPIIFAYNGGPGSDSAWLHFGLLGPRRIEVGEPEEGLVDFPYELQDNEEFLIDICDIVLIDPVGTGFTQVLTEEAKHKYYGVQGDAESFARLIENWIAQHSRWDASVYLLGESYGTIRNVALADVLPKAIHLAGIISVGTSFNVGLSELHVEPCVRRMEAYAAAAWYHHRENKPPLAEHLQQAHQFAYTDYAKALLWGSQLPLAEYEQTLKQLQYFTAMPESHLRRNHLRFSERDFVQMVCPGEEVSVYDARIKAPTGPDRKAAGDMNDEPQTAAVGPAFAAAVFKYLYNNLKFMPDRQYRQKSLEIAVGWDYQSGGINTMDLLERLMRRKPDLRVFFVNGLFDLQSTADFVTYYLAQYEIPGERTLVRAYESGHMTYFGKPFYTLTRDLRRFIINEE
ncbi:MAG TPA: hypothetical protein IAB67_06995 [Candidatus Ventrousia excrementavium]|uniref:Peptidase S10 n=1 Tax=Candidatus Ventrousia excrementavium TaxID=2840961 RepID=A0A9D1IVB6_9CLOT|nr:hypothetical protein [Candidatus Ventrousia excrementavium]